jgi:hypothetical protein
MAPKISQPPKSFYLALVLEISPAAPANVAPADLSRVGGAPSSPASSLQALPNEALLDILCRDASGGHVGIGAC